MKHGPVAVPARHDESELATLVGGGGAPQPVVLVRRPRRRVPTVLSLAVGQSPAGEAVMAVVAEQEGDSAAIPVCNKSSFLYRPAAKFTAHYTKGIRPRVHLRPILDVGLPWVWVPRKL